MRVDRTSVLSSAEEALLERAAHLATHVRKLQAVIHGGHAKDLPWGRCQEKSCVDTRAVLAAQGATS